MRISRIRLSDKTSCVRPRTKLGEGPQLHQSQSSVEVLVGEARTPATLHFVLDAQPPAEPTDRVAVNRVVALANRAKAEVGRPALQQAIDTSHDLGGVARIGPPFGLGVQPLDHAADTLLRRSCAQVGTARRV